MPDTGGVTLLLREIGAGNKDAMTRLLPLIYEELHRLARGYFRRERVEHTLQPTALVHEAFLKLVDQREPVESRAHFLALAATQMRRVLVDYARRHKAERRGGKAGRVQLEDTVAIAEHRTLEIMGLDAALSKLAALDPLQARMVELRFFAGLSVEQTAEVMGISSATVKRSWSSARAFLRRELEEGSIDARTVARSPRNF